MELEHFFVACPNMISKTTPVIVYKDGYNCSDLEPLLFTWKNNCHNNPDTAVLN
jgi:hypothetical protein